MSSTDYVLIIGQLCTSGRPTCLDSMAVSVRRGEALGLKWRSREGEEESLFSSVHHESQNTTKAGCRATSLLCPTRLFFFLSCSSSSSSSSRLYRALICCDLSACFATALRELLYIISDVSLSSLWKHTLRKRENKSVRSGGIFSKSTRSKRGGGRKRGGRVRD